MTCSGTIVVESVCVPNWKCNAGTGVEEDGCGNTRTTSSCTNAYTALQMSTYIIPMDLRYDINNNGIVDTGDVTLLSNGAALKPYRRATIANCDFPTTTIIKGSTANITININQGTITENYKLVVSGAISFESSPFTVNYGIGTESITLTTPSLSNIGSNNVIISLVRR